MNINKVTDALKGVGLFLLANLTGILFLAGIAVIVYGFFQFGTITGIFALGIAAVLISLILARERG